MCRHEKQATDSPRSGADQPDLRNHGDPRPNSRPMALPRLGPTVLQARRACPILACRRRTLDRRASSRTSRQVIAENGTDSPKKGAGPAQQPGQSQQPSDRRQAATIDASQVVGHRCDRHRSPRPPWRSCARCSRPAIDFSGLCDWCLGRPVKRQQRCSGTTEL